MTFVEDRSEGKRRLTIREAATLLNVHPNTVRSRIKDGSIKAEKVVTERGPTWMIDPDSLTTNTPTSGSQQLVGRVPEEALTLLAREIVREAGIKPPDPEEVRWLEGSKLHMEAAKTQVVATSGVVVAIGAIGSFVPEIRAMHLLGWAFAALVVSLAANFTYMYATASATRAADPRRRRITRFTSRLWWMFALSITGFFLGLLVFFYWVSAQVH